VSAIAFIVYAKQIDSTDNQDKQPSISKAEQPLLDTTPVTQKKQRSAFDLQPLLKFNKDSLAFNQKTGQISVDIEWEEDAEAKFADVEVARITSWDFKGYSELKQENSPDPIVLKAVSMTPEKGNMKATKSRFNLGDSDSFSFDLPEDKPPFMEVTLYARGIGSDGRETARNMSFFLQLEGEDNYKVLAKTADAIKAMMPFMPLHIQRECEKNNVCGLALPTEM